MEINLSDTPSVLFHDGHRCYTNNGSVIFGFHVHLREIYSNSVSAMTQTTANAGGNITSDGGATVTARGICWSTTSGPTTALSTKTIDGTGTGIFTSSMTALAAGTVYYVKAYATNSAGTSYWNEISFITLATVPGAPTIGIT
jgi:hypothetical protein